jgi:SAM-dependent methyltransferase
VTPEGSVIGLDVDPGMLAVAQSLRPGIAYREGSANALPFADASFDAVVSQFGMMFFPDAPGALREMWRVCRPGGRLAVAVWASLEETPAYDIETRLVERIGGPSTSRPMRLPFSMGNRATFEAQFAQAGVPLRALHTVVGTGRFPSIRAMVAADVVGWLPLLGVQLSPPTIEAILDAAERDLAPFRQADGTVAFASPAHIAIAVRDD